MKKEEAITHFYNYKRQGLYPKHETNPYGNVEGYLMQTGWSSEEKQIFVKK